MKVSFNVQKGTAAFFNNSSTFWNMGFNCAALVDAEMRILAGQLAMAPATTDAEYFTARVVWDGGEGFRGDVTSPHVSEAVMLSLESNALEAMERLRQARVARL